MTGDEDVETEGTPGADEMTVEPWSPDGEASSDISGVEPEADPLMQDAVEPAPSAEVDVPSTAEVETVEVETVEFETVVPELETVDGWDRFDEPYDVPRADDVAPETESAPLAEDEDAWWYPVTGEGDEDRSAATSSEDSTVDAPAEESTQASIGVDPVEPQFEVTVAPVLPWGAMPPPANGSTDAVPGASAPPVAGAPVGPAGKSAPQGKKGKRAKKGKSAPQGSKAKKGKSNAKTTEQPASGSDD